MHREIGEYAVWISDNPHILVVDDEEMVRINIVAYLEDEGYQVKAADSGEEALRILTQRYFDLMIVDMRLPGMDGNELIIQSITHQPRLNYLIHTGSTEYRVPERLKQMGIKEEQILLKPLSDMSKIVDNIRKILKAR